MLDILIIDDDLGQLDLFSTAFKLKKFKVETAQSGEEGLQKALEKSPSLIFLDFVMPGLTGLDVLKKIKAEPKLKDTKVILMTNLSKPGLLEEIMTAGADDFIMKSNLTPTEMLERGVRLMPKDKGQIKNEDNN